MHSQNFREEAIRQVVEFGYPVSIVSKRLGIPFQLLIRWLENSGHDVEKSHEHSENSIQRENNQLRMELDRVRKERDELKLLLESQERTGSSGKKRNVA